MHIVAQRNIIHHSRIALYDAGFLKPAHPVYSRGCAHIYEFTQMLHGYAPVLLQY